MVIDMHLHPIFYKPICEDAEELEKIVLASGNRDQWNGMKSL